MSKFAEDTKLYRALGDARKADMQRGNLRRMFGWSEDWQMLFNLEKSSVMHMRTRNQELSYEMGGKVLQESNYAQDCKAVFSSLLPSRQCAEASKTANSTLGMIRSTLVTRNKDTILRLYKSLFRPQLEYCIQVWNQFLQWDIKNWRKCKEEPQKLFRATSLVTESPTNIGNMQYMTPLP